MNESSNAETVVPKGNEYITQSTMKHYSLSENRLKFSSYLELILKKPGKLLFEINNSPKASHFLVLTLFCSAFFLIYSIVVGSFSGGEQYWVAPVKILIGLYTSALICLPSLYIFACLDQTKIGFLNIIGNLLISLNLTGILLIGFAPVSWIFSQSTTSIPFIGFIHICIYLVALLFGFKLHGYAVDSSYYNI